MLPIVLHHGIFGYDQIQIGPVKCSYFAGGIEAAIADRGYPVIKARVSQLHSIASRAEQLKQLLIKELERLGTPDGKVVIFAHSMGGLDARYMVQKLDMARHVRAIVTLGTPHRGSSYADWVLKNIDNIKPLQQLFQILRFELSGTRDLTLDAMARFNEQIPDHPEIAYYSISAERPWHRVPAFFFHSHKVITEAEGPNDGMVSVQSAKWANHLGTWPADHLHMVNRRLVMEIIQPTGNVKVWYLKILERLENDGVLDCNTDRSITV